jgi:hypothetical protein
VSGPKASVSPRRRGRPSVRSVPKSPRFGRDSWTGLTRPAWQEAIDFQVFRDDPWPIASACHAEGRGFESLQPLSRRPAFAGLFGAGVGWCDCVAGSRSGYEEEQRGRSDLSRGRSSERRVPSDSVVGDTARSDWAPSSGGRPQSLSGGRLRRRRSAHPPPTTIRPIMSAIITTIATTIRVDPSIMCSRLPCRRVPPGTGRPNYDAWALRGGYPLPAAGEGEAFGEKASARTPARRGRPQPPPRCARRSATRPGAMHWRSVAAVGRDGRSRSSWTGNDSTVLGSDGRGLGG